MATAAIAPLVVVTGIGGSGKSSVGLLLARRLQAEFLEGDELHPASNLERMAAGIALTAINRRDWLLEIAQQLADARAGRHALVVACAATRRLDREMLRTAASQLAFVHLDAALPLIQARTPLRADAAARELANVEPPRSDERALVLDAALPAADLARDAATWISQWKPEPARKK